MTKIGFIGLGNMGSKMALNLLKSNYDVMGYDINKKFVENLLPYGLKKASDVVNISVDTDVVITMLPNGEIVEEVYDKIINNFKPGTLLVDCSTIDVDKAKVIHQKCRPLFALFQSMYVQQIDILYKRFNGQCIDWQRLDGILGIVPAN